MKMRLELTIMVVMLALFSSAKAQKVAVKTDLINDVCLSPNLGMEVGLAPRWTIDMAEGGNTGFCNPKSGIGSVTVLLVIFLARMCMVGNIISGDLMVVFIS